MRRISSYILCLAENSTSVIHHITHKHCRHLLRNVEQVAGRTTLWLVPISYLYIIDHIQPEGIKIFCGAIYSFIKCNGTHKVSRNEVTNLLLL